MASKRKTKKKVSNKTKVTGDSGGGFSSLTFKEQLLLTGAQSTSYVDGKYICRQLGFINELNPDGLSLEAIDFELDYAFNPQGDEDLLVDQIRRESGEDYASIIGLEPTSADSENEKAFSYPWPDHLIQDDDKRLADLIRASPYALLRSFNAQDALARWTYAVRYSHNPATKQKAKQFLKTAIPPARGNPGKVSLNLPQLLQAYDDCCAYVKLIYAYAKKLARQRTRAVTRSPEAISNAQAELLKYFTDADMLGDCDVNLSELVQDLKGPEPSQVAAEYIHRSHGLSVSRVMDLITKARNITGKRKT